MAPASNSTSSRNSTTAASPWNQAVPLQGSHFKDGYVLASLVLACACFLVLVGVLFSSFWLRKKGDNSRRVFTWVGLGFASVVTLVVLGLQIVDVFMHEFAVPVTNLYIIVGILILFFSYKFKILVVTLIYLLVLRRIQVRRGKNENAFPGLQWLHGILLLALVGIWFASGYFQIRQRIYMVLATNVVAPGFGNALGPDFLPSSTNQSSPYLLPYEKLSAIFRIVVQVASLEIVGLAGFIYHRGRREGVMGRIPRYTLFLVAIPWAIRSIVDAALSIKYELIPSSAVPESREVRLVEIILTWIPTVITFVGIAMIGFQPDWAADHGTESMAGTNSESSPDNDDYYHSNKNGPGVRTREFSS